MRDWTKYALGLAAIVLFGLFVYPTMYEYDKLDQRLPVKINRITGNAEILTTEGWINPGDYDTAVEEIKKFKSEILSKLADDREMVKQDVINAIKDEVITSVQGELEATRIAIEKYKLHELDPTTYFTIGDTMDTVKSIMGAPDDIQVLGFTGNEWWYYGSSKIEFSSDKTVEAWNNNGNLRVR